MKVLAIIVMGKMLQLTDFKSKTRYEKQEGSSLILACQANSVARFNDRVARFYPIFARLTSFPNLKLTVSIPMFLRMRNCMAAFS